MTGSDVRTLDENDHRYFVEQVAPLNIATASNTNGTLKADPITGHVTFDADSSLQRLKVGDFCALDLGGEKLRLCQVTRVEAGNEWVEVTAFMPTEVMLKHLAARLASAGQVV